MTTAAEATALPAVDEIDGPLPRRERKRREVRNRLYEAAISLFTEQGFEATTMDAIAERADVARATVFNYYGHKVAFLEEWGADGGASSLAGWRRASFRTSPSHRSCAGTYGSFRR